jgi:hypothetical protein
MAKLERGRIRTALDDLSAGAANLDVKALRGSSPWLRLRVGDWRLIYRPLTTEEAASFGCSAGFLIARVVNRRDLERAVRKL